MDGPLVSSPDAVTAGWLTDALRSAGVARDARVAAISRRERIGTGQMARNERFQLEWEGDTEGVPASVVGKFPSDDPTSRATGGGQGAYLKEVEFYRHIAPTVDVRTPRIYAVDLDAETGDFVLLMEDLAGSEQGDQLAGCTLDEAAVVVEEAAKLHAPRWGDPALVGFEFLGGDRKAGAAGLEQIYAAVLPGFEARYASRLDPEVMALAERLGARVARWALGFDTPHTVTHGDFRLDNLLFGRAPGAPPVAVVDWQTVGRGPGAGDVAYFLGGGLAPEPRRAEEPRLVRAWWESLRARGVSDYAWDDCWRDYRLGTYGGLVVAVVASQIVVQTERGDDMFVAMSEGAGRHALDLEAEKLLS